MKQVCTHVEAPHCARDRKTTSIYFLLLDNFSLLSFSSAMEPLRMANKLLGHHAFQYQSCSIDGEDVQTSSGHRMSVDDAMDQVHSADLVVVCSSDNVEQIRLPQTLAGKLRSLQRHGCALAAICTGSFVLARLGLLDGYRCTIHWEYSSIFRETFPKIDLKQSVVEIDRNRYTCAGGTGALDLMLTFLGRSQYPETAGAVADMAIHHDVRDTEKNQRLSLKLRLGVKSPTLVEAIRLMERNIEMPLTGTEISAALDISTRQLQRVFRQHTDRSPTEYYMSLRLDTARDLLRKTAMSVSEVGFACGFVSMSHFTKCYRKTFQVRPHEDRQAYRGKLGVVSNSTVADANIH